MDNYLQFLVYALITIIILTIRMTDQTFDVIISDKEYHQLKENKKKNEELSQNVKDLQLKVNISTEHCQSLQKEVLQKDQQITFLIDFVNNLCSGKGLEQQNSINTNKSATFEILGQSIIEPQAAIERKKVILNEQLAKKYTPLVKKATELEERLESQEELISKLNEMNLQKNEVLLNQNENQIRDALNKNSQLEKQVTVITKEHEKLRVANVDLKDNNRKIIAENEALSNKIFNSNSRIKELEMELYVLKEGLKSTFPKRETKDQIKGLIDQYVREVQKNLKGIQGLTEKEIKDLLEEEMKEIVDYIPKSILRKK